MVLFPLVRRLQYQLVVVPAVFSALSILAVALRLLAKRRANRPLDASDYLILASLVVSVAYSGVTMAGAFVGGGGYHVVELVAGWGMEPIQTFLKLGIAVQALWATSLSLCKLSILVLYTRVFTLRPFIIAARVTAAVVIAWALGTVLGGLLQCHPFAYNWDQTIAGGSCSNQILSYKITGSINIVTDIAVLFLPMPYLAVLELKLYKKLVLMATFALGFFYSSPSTMIVGALRLHSITSMDYSDITYTVVPAEVFSAIEPALAITLACVPLLRPLLGGRYSASGTKLEYRDEYDASGANPPTNGTFGGSSSKRPRTISKTTRTKKFDTAGFDMINENSSEYQLRPVGVKYNAEVTVKSSGSASQYSGSEGRSGEFGSGGQQVIAVRQEWKVNQERKEVGI